MFRPYRTLFFFSFFTTDFIRRYQLFCPAGTLGFFIFHNGLHPSLPIVLSRWDCGFFYFSRRTSSVATNCFVPLGLWVFLFFTTDFIRRYQLFCPAGTVGFFIFHDGLHPSLPIVLSRWDFGFFYFSQRTSSVVTNCFVPLGLWVFLFFTTDFIRRYQLFC